MADIQCQLCRWQIDTLPPKHALGSQISQRPTGTQVNNPLALLHCQPSVQGQGQVMRRGSGQASLHLQSGMHWCIKRQA